MESTFIAEALAGILAALLGVLFPSFKELIRILSTRRGSAEFFKSNAVGREILKLAGLGRSVDGPEALFKELSAASDKMDAIVSRIQDYTKGREQAVSRLESQLGLLSQQEEELRERIEGLRNVPLPAAEYFVRLVTKGERRSAARDYVLFLLGVLVTTGVGILIRKLGWA